MNPILQSTEDTPFGLYAVSFTRVRELLDDPTDLTAAAAMFCEELKEELPMDYVLIVIAAEPITPEELTRDEIEYIFTVLMAPDDYARYLITVDDAAFSFEIREWEEADGSHS